MKGMLGRYRKPGRCHNRSRHLYEGDADRYRKLGRCHNRSRHLYEGNAGGLGPPPSGWTSWTGTGNQGDFTIGADTSL
jgi:hypothetical protein